jgi:hypothetical protein
MKNVFHFAMYPALIAELQPRTIFQMVRVSAPAPPGSTTRMILCGIDGRVHSVDLRKATVEHPLVSSRQGDCSDPAGLFDAALLRSAPHPWLVVEDAHHNVAAVLGHTHAHLAPGAYLVVEDSDIKREALHISRRSSRRLPGGYAFHRQFRPQCHLRRRFYLRSRQARRCSASSELNGAAATAFRTSLIHRSQVQRCLPLDLEISGDELGELEACAGQSPRSHTAYGFLMSQLEEDGRLTPDDLKMLRALIVGNADAYLKYDDDFGPAKQELNRIIDKFRQIQSGYLGAEALMQLPRIVPRGHERAGADRALSRTKAAGEEFRGAHQRRLEHRYAACAGPNDRRLGKLIRPDTRTMWGAGRNAFLATALNRSSARDNLPSSTARAAR